MTFHYSVLQDGAQRKEEPKLALTLLRRAWDCAFDLSVKDARKCSLSVAGVLNLKDMFRDFEIVRLFDIGLNLVSQKKANEKRTRGFSQVVLEPMELRSFKLELARKDSNSILNSFARNATLLSELKVN